MPARVLHNAPGKYRPITDAIARMLEGARETLDVVNPYVTDRGMIRRIEEAARRGVRVRLFVPANANNWACAGAQQSHHAKLLDSGVAIYEYPAMLHAKAFVRDGEELLAGTCNLEAWSLKRFFEIDLLVRSEAVAAQFDERFSAPAVAVSGAGPPPDAASSSARGRRRSPRSRRCSDAGTWSPEATGPRKRRSSGSGDDHGRRGRETGPMAAEATAAPSARAAGAGLVLMTLAAGQFLMTLDSSVMNVSIATVAKDVGTTVTGIQGAITAYTLVMAALMITGAKVGAIIGRKRAFTIGCVIYGCGSLTTSLATSLPVLLFGWSFLEGVGAALILPAIVALVAVELRAGAPAGRVRDGRRRRRDRRRRRPADRRLLHDLLLVALGLRRRGRRRDRDPHRSRERSRTLPPRRDRSSTSSARSSPRPGLGALVFGVLRSSEWGWIQPKPGGPSWAGSRRRSGSS